MAYASKGTQSFSSYCPPEVSSVVGLIETHMRYNEMNGPDRGYEIYHPSAFGKAQPLDAMVQTPFGPKRMGDIQIGDEVSHPDGGISNVVAIHPQGRKVIYRVTFTNGDSAECCEDHLWEVDSNQLGFIRPKVMSTKAMLKVYLSPSGARNLFVQLPKPLTMRSEAPTDITPYIMGVMLGDGCLRCNAVDFTSIDDEVVERVRRELIAGYEVKSRKNGVQHRICQSESHNLYKRTLQHFGLHGLRTAERFIPDAYLYVREEDRWALLQGLMDTDGTVSSKGHVSFSSSSPKMATQIKWLVESLGGTCTIYTKPTKKLTNYDCYIRHPESHRLFSLRRKVERAKTRAAWDGKRIIKNIRPVGEKEAQCITVSREDGLYLTDNCIVTHNCLRLMQYQRYESRGMIKGDHESFGGRMLRLFGNGHVMHARWVKYFEELGILRGVWACENPLCRLFDDDGTLAGQQDGEIADEAKYIIANPEKFPGRVYGEDILQGVFKPDKCACGAKNFRYDEVLVQDKELNFKGHCDIILDFSRFDWHRFDDSAKRGLPIFFDPKDLPKGLVVVDMKSCGKNAYANTVMKTGPHKYYQTQLQVYVNVLKCEFGLLLYEEKDSFELAAFKIEQSDEKWAKIRWQALQMQEMASGPKPLLPPPRPISKSSYDCKSCPFAKHCMRPGGIWDDPQLERKRKEFYGDLL